MNQARMLKAVTAWVSVVYVICFAGVALFPASRELFMLYALHTQTPLGENVMTLTTFISGLIIWNVIAFLAVWLFISLRNAFK